jgi:hypothetical protein
MPTCNYPRCDQPATTTDRIGDPVCARHKLWESCAECGDVATFRDKRGATFCPVHLDQADGPRPIHPTGTLSSHPGR